jgi:hypothetical protein
VFVFPVAAGIAVVFQGGVRRNANGSSYCWPWCREWSARGPHRFSLDWLCLPRSVVCALAAVAFRDGAGVLLGCGDLPRPGVAVSLRAVPVSGRARPPPHLLQNASSAAYQRRAWELWWCLLGEGGLGVVVAVVSAGVVLGFWVWVGCGLGVLRVPGVVVVVAWACAVLGLRLVSGLCCGGGSRGMVFTQDGIAAGAQES